MTQTLQYNIIFSTSRVAEGERVIKPDAVADDFWWESVAVVQVGLFAHGRIIPDFVLSRRPSLNLTIPQSPRVITVDKNAAYPKTIETLKADKTLCEATELRQKNYLNNIVEQAHRAIKRRAERRYGKQDRSTQHGRSLKGFEATNMTRKGQVQDVKKRTV